MLNAEQCWAAVIAHDARQDGRFFYSVKTTGVYCRPGCASRQPRRENVAFYETAAAAEAAGFRACKRCRPNEGSQADRHVAAIGRACALIRRSDEIPSLAELADAAGISRFHFHRVFKQITGTTPRQWGKAHRLGRFADRLDAGEGIAEAAYGAGFGASSRAYEAAPNGLGMTPAARHPRHGLPGAGVACLAEDPAGPHRDLYRHRRRARPAEGGARRGAGLRLEQAGGGRAMPSGRAPRR